MDPEQAKVLFDEGAIFMLLDFPTGSEFGIDYTSWTVGPDFKGVKMIPAGIHYVYYSAVSQEGQHGPRSGFFYNFSSKEFLVRKWDCQMEDLSPEEIPPEQVAYYQSHKEDCDKHLGPYPFDRYKQWVGLSSHVSKDLVDLLQPDCGQIRSMAQFQSVPSTSQSRLAVAAAEGGSPKKELPKMKVVEGTNIKYSVIPKKRYPDGSTAAEISKYSMDSSYLLEMLISERFKKDFTMALGEIQFAFLCFIIGQNYDSFEHWKKLVHLLCTCSDAVLQYPQEFLSFIPMLYFQIHEIPSDFFVDIVTSDNFLTVTLHELFQNVLSDNVDPKLRKRAHGFQKHLTEKFKWDFTSEPDDMAPVVVDLGE